MEYFGTIFMASHAIHFSMVEGMVITNVTDTLTGESKQSCPIPCDTFAKWLGAAMAINEDLTEVTEPTEAEMPIRWIP